MGSKVKTRLHDGHERKEHGTGKRVADRQYTCPDTVTYVEHEADEEEFKCRISERVEHCRKKQEPPGTDEPDDDHCDKSERAHITVLRSP